ncbi:MAG: DUF3800 domain-containing protein [Chloroflexota bacterium]|nr:DUF3800 domain-containing protein [Chloroflexota bacterium]
MYVAFVDESGDPSLDAVNREFPVFCQVAVIFLEREYASRADPQVKQFKQTALGDAGMLLRARQMAKQHGPFKPLIARERRRQFGQSLSDLLAGLPLVLVGACLNKEMHRREYGSFRRLAYAFTTPFLMERLVYLMSARHDGVAVVAQSHGRREDAALRSVWEEHLGDGSYYHAATEFSSRLTRLDFRPARDNLSGLQLADLAACACARFVLDPQQPNAVFAALSAKLYQGKFTEPDRFGLKVIP